MPFRVWLPLYVVFYVVALVYFVSGLDDLLMDVLYVLKGRKSARRLDLATLDSVPPKRIAIMVPAWDEGKVIAAMVSTNRELLMYPETRYDFFVGTYPNDEPTQVALAAGAKGAFNVHVVINRSRGPTGKAQNLNELYAAVVDWETRHGTQFDILVLHDAEDLIHPLSLKLYNYLIPPNDYVQIPVVPMQPSGPGRSFFGYLTRGTYADEFAENHFRHMLTREGTSAFIPSAGVGTAVSREAARLLAQEHDGAPFALGSLTEDYEFSMRMTKMGLRGVYYAEGVARLDSRGRLVNEFVATKEMFPNSFAQAVRQKTRWIYGITFQTPARVSWRGGTLAQRYSVIRDSKAKFTNLVTIPGLVVNLAAALLFFSPAAAHGLANLILFRLLLPANFAFSLVRFASRGLAVAQVYGFREAVNAVLLPPLVPLRYLWGNAINFAATLRAWRTHFFGSQAQKRKWAKTQHDTFAPAEEIAAYRRKLGDILLQKRLIDAARLRKLLARQSQERVPLGELLLQTQTVSESDLLAVLGELTGRGVVDLDERWLNPGLAVVLPKHLATAYGVVPLAASATTLVVATPRPPSQEALAALERACGRRVHWTLASAHSILKSLASLYRNDSDGPPVPRLGERLLDGKVIGPEQLLEALGKQAELGRPLGEVLVALGFATPEQIGRWLEAPPRSTAV